MGKIDENSEFERGRPLGDDGKSRDQSQFDEPQPQAAECTSVEIWVISLIVIFAYLNFFLLVVDRL